MLQADFLRPDAMPIRLEQMLFLLMNDIGIFGFNIGLDTPTVNIVINSIPLATSGDRDWTPTDWNIDTPGWTELENELTAFNPELRLMDRPKWIKSVLFKM